MESGTHDDRPHQRQRANPVGTRWDMPPSSSPQSQATPARPQAAPAQPAPGQPGSAGSTSSSPATVTPELLAQMLQCTLQATQQQTTQMGQLLAQTAQLQQQILQAQSRPRPTRKKADPPRFEGNDDDDLELWIFSTEQYYVDFQGEMHEHSSSFSDMVFANLGVDAQAWYRDLKISMGSTPLTWNVFKERIRSRFRDKDFKYKTLSKMYELKPTKSQQEYTSRFLHLLSQVDTELPDVVKRWFYQQNLPADTSAYISRNAPVDLDQAIEMAQRFEDAKPADRRPPSKEQGKTTTKFPNNTNSKANKNFKKADAQTVCGYCSKKNHVEAECHKKARNLAAGNSGSPKNGPAR